MSYSNFVPVVWAKNIEKAMQETHVFAKHCDREVEGALKEAGDTVKFTSMGTPTIHDVDYDDRNEDIEGPETLADASFTMQVRKIADFNFMVGDIDAKIANKKLLPHIKKELTPAMTGKIDRYIASFALRDEAVKLYAQAVKAIRGNTTSSAKNVLEIIDDAAQKLFENNVPERTPVFLTVSPRFYTMVKQAYGDLDTDNSDIMRLGRVGRYNDVTLERSNNVAKSTDGTIDYMFCRTEKYMGYAEVVNNVEGYRPEAKHADAVKGRVLYDAKILRPKQGIVVNVKYA